MGLTLTEIIKINSLFEMYNKNDIVEFNPPLEINIAPGNNVKCIIYKIYKPFHGSLQFAWNNDRKHYKRYEEITEFSSFQLKQIIEQAGKLYPDFGEGEAIGFFNMNEDHINNMLNRVKNEEEKRSILLNDLKIFVKVNGGKIDFDPPLHVSTKGYSSYDAIHIRLENILICNIVNANDYADIDMDSWDLRLITTFYNKIKELDEYKEFDKNRNDYEEGEAMGFFNMNEEVNIDTIRHAKTIQLFFDQFNKNDRVEFEPPLELIIPKITKTVFFIYTLRYNEYGKLIMEYVIGNSPYSTIIETTNPDALENLIKVLTERFPDFEWFQEGEAMGFFNMNEANIPSTVDKNYTIINSYVEYYGVNDRVIFNPPLFIEAKRIHPTGINFSITTLINQANYIMVKCINDLPGGEEHSANLIEWDKAFTKLIVEQLQILSPEFFEGEAMGFFSLKENFNDQVFMELFDKMEKIIKRQKYIEIDEQIDTEFLLSGN